jgi:hypothetical protein
MQQLDQTLVVAANIYNNSNKYHLFSKVKVSKVNQITCVDHLFQLGVNVMYHEDMYLVVQQV